MRRSTQIRLNANEAAEARDVNEAARVALALAVPRDLCSLRGSRAMQSGLPGCPPQLSRRATRSQSQQKHCWTWERVARRREQGEDGESACSRGLSAPASARESRGGGARGRLGDSPAHASRGPGQQAFPSSRGSLAWPVSAGQHAREQRGGGSGQLGRRAGKRSRGSLGGLDQAFGKARQLSAIVFLAVGPFPPAPWPSPAPAAVIDVVYDDDQASYTGAI